MDDITVPGSITDISEYKHALQTAKYTADYERSSRLVDSVTKDEEVRLLRCQIFLLQDELEALNEQLANEEENVDDLEQRLVDAECRGDELDEEAQKLSDELRAKARELENVKAELGAMQTVSNDSTKVLAEKFALSRELAQLKPELESLRTQTASQKELLAEKLSLQRELTTLQVELENAQRSTQRAKAKAGKNNQDESEWEAQIDQLQRELKDEKSARKDAVREVDQLKKDLASEKKAAARVDEKQAKGGEANESLRDQLSDLRKELAAEKRERQRVEKAFHKEQDAWEAQKSLLEDKLGQFRTKLRSTKDKLKEAEAELHIAQVPAASKPVATIQPDKQATKSRKRGAAMMDPDAIGTPGDGPPAKRGKRSQSIVPTAVGDKSTFSITPFLNRTMSLAPDTPMSDAEEPVKKNAATTETGEANPEESPSTAATKKVPTKRAPKPKPLSQASTGKHNAKARGRKKAFSTLEKVAEEASEPENKSPAAPAPETKADEQPSEPAPKTKATTLKPRKSIAMFPSFNEEAEPEKRKKRKLGGSGFPKTLFDEEDDQPPSKPIPGRGLFAARGFNKVFGAKKGPLSMADNGFQFSPLKKDRRAASIIAAD